MLKRKLSVLAKTAKTAQMVLEALTLLHVTSVSSYSLQVGERRAPVPVANRAVTSAAAGVASAQLPAAAGDDRRLAAAAVGQVSRQEAPPDVLPRAFDDGAANPSWRYVI